MPERIVLQTVERVPEGYRLTKPSIPVHTSSENNHYLCGRCSTLLLVAGPEQLQGIVIECRECGTLNKADS
jgi:DNA-directed RNA polymerase subunit RPC12/RpoP